jgi:hypothetical protein
MIWIIMREAAIQRHYLLHKALGALDPITWSGHMQIVRNFYGW